MSSLEPKKPWFKSLRFRVLALLTIALIPFGFMSVWQTKSIEAEMAESTRLTLLALTEQAALTERLVIQRAIGAADFLGSVAPLLVGDSKRCQEYFQHYLDQEDRFSLVGVLPISGIMSCSSSERSIDFSSYPNFQESLLDPGPNVSVNMTAPLSGKSVIIVSRPFSIEGTFAGFIAISIPHENLTVGSMVQSEHGLLDLITFNTGGDILTSFQDLSSAALRLPQTHDLRQLATPNEITFTAPNAEGDMRVFAVVPVEDSALFVLGVWGPRTSFFNPVFGWLSPMIFPALMWITGLLVVYGVIHKLVSRPIQSLQLQMRDFGQNRELSPKNTSTTLPSELSEINDTFRQMARKIIHDEETLTDAVVQKNVFIKEIHHRVKNNLQLISSIINMQIRDTSNVEAKTSLHQIRQRVLSLSTIHNNIYQPETSGKIDARTLIEKILAASEMLVSLQRDEAFDIKLDLEDVRLPLDQAVPFSLFVGETSAAIAQALMDSGQKIKSYSVSLKVLENGVYALTQTSSATSIINDASLCARLLEAFTAQLDAETVISGNTIRLTFRHVDTSTEIANH